MRSTVPIQLRCRLGPSDVVRALELHTACPALMLVAGWAVTAAVSAVLIQRDQGAVWLVECLLLLAAALAALVVAVPLGAAWRRHRARAFFALHEVRADANGVRVSGGCESGLLPWAGIRRWRESAQQFLIYENLAEFVVVPKHAFASSEELRAFRATRVRHLGQRNGATTPAEGA